MDKVDKEIMKIAEKYCCDEEKCKSPAGDFSIMHPIIPVHNLVQMRVDFEALIQSEKEKMWKKMRKRCGDRLFPEKCFDNSTDCTYKNCKLKEGE